MLFIACSLRLLSSLTPPLGLPLPLTLSFHLLHLALVGAHIRVCICGCSSRASSRRGTGVSDSLESLLGDLSRGQLLFLVPPPLVDLALAETCQLGEVKEALLGPVGITCKLVF